MVRLIIMWGDLWCMGPHRGPLTLRNSLASFMIWAFLPEIMACSAFMMSMVSPWSRRLATVLAILPRIRSRASITVIVLGSVAGGFVWFWGFKGFRRMTGFVMSVFGALGAGAYSVFLG